MSIIENFIQGDTLEIPLIFEEEQTDGSFLPIDITNWTIWFTVKSDPRDIDDDAIIGPIEVTVHTDPVNGKTLISISKEQTNIPVKDNYWYDLQTKDAAGAINTIEVDNLDCLQGVTHTN